MKGLLMIFVSSMLLAPALALADLKAEILAAGSNGDAKRIEELVAKKADVNAKDENGMTPLMKAAMTNNLAGAAALIKHKAKVNATDKIGNTALNIAVQYKRVPFAKLLLDNKADADHRNSVEEGTVKFITQGKVDAKSSVATRKGESNISIQQFQGGAPLFIAALSGQRDLVKLLLEHKADPNVRSKFDKATPLIAAISVGDMEMVKMLLSYKADPNKGSVWWTPLTGAITLKRKDMVIALIEKKVAINDSNGFGEPPLYTATVGGQTDMVKLLLDNKAKVNQYSRSFYTPLFMACQQGYKDIVNLLLSNGAKDLSNFNNNTAFTVAAFSGHLPIVKILLEHKFYNKAKNAQGWNALHMSIQEGNLEMVKFLVENGLDVNERIFGGRTPLMLAGQFSGSRSKGKGPVKDYPGIIKYLISKGAKINDYDNFGNSVLSFAAMGGNLELVKITLDGGCQVDNERFGTKNMLGNFMVETPLMYALASGRMDVARFLISKGAKTNARFSMGGYVLHYACQGAKLDFVKQLIAGGADIYTKDFSNRNAAMYAIIGDNAEVLQYLLSGRSEKDEKEWKKWYPYYIVAACQSGSLNALKILVARGADLKDKWARNEFGWTPLMIAARNSDIMMVLYLKSKGCDINEPGSRNVTALHVASQFGQTSFISALMTLGAKYTKFGFGVTPIKLAGMVGNMNTAYLFYQYGYNK